MLFRRVTVVDREVDPASQAQMLADGRTRRNRTMTVLGLVGALVVVGLISYLGWANSRQGEMEAADMANPSTRVIVQQPVIHDDRPIIVNNPPVIINQTAPEATSGPAASTGGTDGQTTQPPADTTKNTSGNMTGTEPVDDGPKGASKGGG